MDKITDDAARFDLSVEIGQRIAFMGSINPVGELENVYRSLMPILPKNSAFTGILSPETYTGGENPPDKEFVGQCLYLLTTAPGMFLTYDDAESALRLCLHATTEIWQQHNRANRNKRVRTAVATAGGVLGLTLGLIFEASPFLTYGVPCMLLGGSYLWNDKVDEQGLLDKVTNRITEMLKVGKEQIRST